MSTVAKVEVSWQQVATGEYPMSDVQKVWHDSIHTQAAKAKAKYPELNGRVDHARDLVLGQLVTPHADGVFEVRSQTKKGFHYVVTQDKCPCPDAENAPQGLCKHVLATMIWRRARTAVETLATAQPQETPPMHDADAAPTAPGIQPKYLVTIQGKSFITYQGLLQMAQDAGLMSLKAEFISVTEKLALARATARFLDGREFGECGDATPENVNKRIAPHFPRMALTRAKARCLRDALSIDMTAVEELAD
jgi:hypothetical protein